MKKSLLLSTVLLLSACSAASSEASSLDSQTESVVEQSDAMPVHVIDQEPVSLTGELIIYNDSFLCDIDGETQELVMFNVNGSQAMLATETMCQDFKESDWIEIVYLQAEMKTPDKTVSVGIVQDLRHIEKVVDMKNLYDALPKNFEVTSIKGRYTDGQNEIKFELEEGIEDFLSGLREIEVNANEPEMYLMTDGFAVIDLCGNNQHLSIIEDSGKISVSHLYSIDLALDPPIFPVESTDYWYGKDEKNPHKLSDYLQGWLGQ